jgi:hypothetical protein
MSRAPVICFGQQPCGFFPKRFLLAKVLTARRWQQEIGGEIVFFYHDSDHDPRETRTILRHRKTQEPAQLNFSYKNKIQRKFSPLYLKEIPDDWQEKTAGQLPNYVDHSLIEIFKKGAGANQADFCLDVYGRMGLLAGIRVMRSSEPKLRREACEIAEYFADVPFEGEIVRARWLEGALKLHEGGEQYLTVPTVVLGKEQISPTRDTRLRWMQSVVRCTHYVAGAGERDYLRPDQTPEITFINRDSIERSDEACIDLL